MEYVSADEYLTDGREHDLVLLDIEMGVSGTDMDGMGLARHIRGMDANRQPIIIFVTGYEKYVYDAFDVGAFQYFVKPVDEVMEGYYNGEISKDEIKGFFMEYCS